MNSIEEQAREGERKYWLNLKTVYQEALARIGNDPDASEAAIVSAAKEVFDRADGKVAEKVELGGDIMLHLDMG